MGFKEIQKPFTLIIEKEVQAKIDYFCLKIHNVEWSGPLFYEEEGSIADNNLVIRVKDIFLMDIGTSGYTEYDESPDIISYRIEKDLLGMRMGLIHSHNNMPTFFSGTDTATLQQEALNHDHFVSLIVNNTRTYSAAITMIVNSKFKSVITEEYKYNTFDGEPIEGVATEEKESEVTTILWTKLKVILEDEKPEDSELSSRMSLVSELKAKKKAEEEEKKKAEAAKKPTSTTTPLANGTYAPKYDEKGHFVGYYPVEQNIKAIPATTKRVEQKEIDFELNPNFTPVDFQQGEEEPNPIDYDEVWLEQNLVEWNLKKILTGSILVPENNKLNIKSLISDMPKMFDKLFSETQAYEFFISNFIETIIFNVEDETIVGYEEEEEAAIAAFSMVKELRKYPSNIYVNLIIENLENYII